MRLVLITLYILGLGVGYSHACANGSDVVDQNTKRQFLKAHNSARKAVGVPLLKWHKGLAEISQNWSRQLAQKCGALEHSKNGVGENLAAYWGGAPRSGIDITNMWVNEKQWYDYKTNSCKPGKVCGHYLQVIWKSTSLVGCGSAYCTMPSGAKKTYWTCSYRSPGNYRGQKPW